MAKNIFNKLLNTSNKFYIFSLIALLSLVYYYLNSSLREGVVFTRFDNEKWFNKPWDKFCVQTPSSCQKNDNFLLVNRDPQIGCWCNDKQQAPLLDNKCTDLEFDPYVEYRR